MVAATAVRQRYLDDEQQKKEKIRGGEEETD